MRIELEYSSELDPHINIFDPRLSEHLAFLSNSYHWIDTSFFTHTSWGKFLCDAVRKDIQAITVKNTTDIHESKGTDKAVFYIRTPAVRSAWRGPNDERLMRIFYYFNEGKWYISNIDIHLVPAFTEDEDPFFEPMFTEVYDE